MAKKKTLAEFPQEVKEIMEISSLEGLLKKFNKKGVDFGIWSIVYTPISQLVGEPDMFMAESCHNMIPSDYIRFPFGIYSEAKHRTSLLFVDKALRTWRFTLSVKDEWGMVMKDWQMMQRGWKPHRSRLTMEWDTDPEPVNKLLYEFQTLQDDQEILERIRCNNPYAYQYVCDCGVNPAVYCMAPQIEQLDKMGFRFLRKFANAPRSYHEARYVSKSEVDAFNRLIQRGTDPKSIFRVPKSVYMGMINESNIMAWDAMRKMVKKGKVSESAVRWMAGYSAKELDLFNSVLNRTYKGKPVFSAESLSNYLGKIDMFEAIGREEGLQLLLDYLRGCEVLEVKPRIDSDSLKREHDVMARNVRQYRDKAMAALMQEKCDELQAYNYREGVFFARAISSYDDLLDEATQQHNCVASYARGIAKGRTLIFVVRKCNAPEKSFITLELDPKDLHVRQKEVACNQPVRNKAASDFISRFQRHCVHVRETAKKESSAA